MQRPPSTSLAVLAVTLATLAMSASGCGSTDPAAASVEPGISATTAGLPSASPTSGTAPAVPAPTAGEEPYRSPRFGQGFRYAGGLAVTVGEPERFRPSPWVKREPGVAMRFEVVVRNRTGDEWNPSQLHVRLLSAFAPAVQIFDYDHRVVARPEERVPAGRTVTFSVGYWVRDADRLTMEFSPGFGYQDITVGG